MLAGLGILYGVWGWAGVRGGAMAAETTRQIPPGLLIQGHRGAAGLAPENTLAAFRKAIQLGADGMEMDLQATRDGAVVVIHDDTVDRTTDGHGRVGDLTLAEIERLDAGAKFAPAFRGERIPTLLEVIQLVKASGDPRVRLALEIKFAKGHQGEPADLEERILAILRQTEFLGRVSIQSFYHPSPAKMKRLEPRIPTGLLVGSREVPSDPVALVRALRADYYAPDYRLVTGELVGTLHGAGIPVVTWTVNDPPEMQRLLEAGVGSLLGDAIISDFPDRALRWLRSGAR